MPPHVRQRLGHHLEDLRREAVVRGNGALGRDLHADAGRVGETAAEPPHAVLEQAACGARLTRTELADVAAQRLDLAVRELDEVRDVSGPRLCLTGGKGRVRGR